HPRPDPSVTVGLSPFPRAGWRLPPVAALMLAVACWGRAVPAARNDPTPERPPATSPPASSSVAPPPVPAVGHRVATIHVGRAPQGLARTAGALWVADFGGDVVRRIDPSTNRLVASVKIGRAS